MLSKNLKSRGEYPAGPEFDTTFEDAFQKEAAFTRAMEHLETLHEAQKLQCTHPSSRRIHPLEVSVLRSHNQATEGIRYCEDCKSYIHSKT